MEAFFCIFSAHFCALLQSIVVIHGRQGLEVKRIEMRTLWVWGIPSDALLFLIITLCYCIVIQ